MKLTREDILKLARLSRLKLSEAEIEKYQKEISSILEYVQQLDSTDVSDLKPTYQVTGLTSSGSNATRSDEVTEQVSQDELFKNLPATESGHIKVKRMIA
jgi:aspartyl-tRNA(Asn)/glutamyl-tRNA(Gln) amidotransferase subunit C